MRWCIHASRWIILNLGSFEVHSKTTTAKILHHLQPGQSLCPSMEDHFWGENSTPQPKPCQLRFRWVASQTMAKHTHICISWKILNEGIQMAGFSAQSPASECPSDTPKMSLLRVNTSLPLSTTFPTVFFSFSFLLQNHFVVHLDERLWCG